MTEFSRLGLVLIVAFTAACSNVQTTIPMESVARTLEPIGSSVVSPRATSRAHQNADFSPQFSAAPDRNLFQLAKELILGTGEILQTTANRQVEYPSGHTETFWLIDVSKAESYQSNFTLSLLTPHAYWYVENNLEIDIARLETSAMIFEEDIYPTITKVFGSEWIPGIDGDQRMYILNGRFENVAGYFNSSDEYPETVRPRSNEKEIIYINAYDIPPGTENYNLVLSHELQHAIHWNADPSEDTWINEGLSELASSVSLGSTFSIGEFLNQTPISLIHWPNSSDSSLANYGAASLIMHFLTEHYGNRDDLRDLLSQPEDSIAGIQQYLEHRGYELSFQEVFKQWSVANVVATYLNSNSQILGYEDLQIQAIVSKSVSDVADNRSEIPQYSTEYTELKSISEPVELSFEGNKDVALLPIDIGPSGCWWSNSGDSISSTLSHPVEIQVGSKAFLEYDVWFEIEENWDYVYIQVSVDDRETWQIIETQRTSLAKPFGNAYGAGYTGKSGGWLTEYVDLTPFAGEDAWVRFQYVTDDAVTATGACFRNLSILDGGIKTSNVGWKPRGFVFTDNLISQNFQVQLITVGKDPRVRQLREMDHTSP